MDEYGKIARVWISAEKGQGLDLLRQALGQIAEAAFEAAAHGKRAAAA